jgi:hypothetical protein
MLVLALGAIFLLWESVGEGGAVKMRGRIAIHHIITGVSEKMKKDLPRGLKCVDNKIRVPESKDKDFYDWCVRHGIGNGFRL